MINQTSIKVLLKRYGLKIFAICFWLLLWQGMSWRDSKELILASPAASLSALFELSKDLDFWLTILFSSLRIVIGFVLAMTVGTVLAIGSHQSKLIKELTSPVMKIIKAMPVASFIILALMWINVKNLSVLISFMMVVPMIYANVAHGLKSTDEKLLQMAKVFQLSRFRKVTAIYVPAVTPYFISAVSVGLGFCWKAGIAAEVIGRPTGSIGERLYEAKLYWMTKELFAWTIVIIIISVLFEKAVLLLFRSLQSDRSKQGEKTAST
jgi:NitT/TauT family transport system permease protein